MKINKLKFFLMLIFSTSLFSCSGFSLQPGFVTILGNEGQAVKLLNAEQADDNSVVFSFSQELKSITTKVFYPENADTVVEIAHKTENITDTESEDITTYDYKCSLFETIDIGKVFKIEGTVNGKNNVQLEFSFSFSGKNHSPALLEINEYKPLYSSSLKNPVPEFIELKVKEGGNLSGLVLKNVGSSKQPDYVFPPATVEKNEIVVVHLRRAKNDKQTVTDETSKDIISQGETACKNARDFWANLADNPKQRKENIVAVIAPNKSLQDCFAYCKSKNTDIDIEWKDELKDLAEFACAENFESIINQPFIAGITASVSISKFIKNEKIIWELTGKKGYKPISRGENN